MSNLIIHDFGKLKLDQDGIWFHNDEKFNHQGIAELFSRSIVKNLDASFSLQLGTSKVSFEYDFTPYIVIDLEFIKDNIILFTNNSNIIQISEVDRLFLDSDYKLYMTYKEDNYSFSKKSYKFLINYFNEDDNGYFLELKDKKLYIDLL